MMENNSDVRRTSARREENRVPRVSVKRCSLKLTKRCTVEIPKLKPSQYLTPKIDSKLKPSQHLSNNWDVRDFIDCPTQLVFESGPGEPGHPSNSRKLTHLLNMSVEDDTEEIKNTDKLAKKGKQKPRKGKKKKGVKNISINEDTKDEVVPMETETIASLLNKSPRMGLNSSKMSPFRRSSKKRKLSTSTDEESCSDSNVLAEDEPCNLAKKLKLSALPSPVTVNEGVPKKRKLTTLSSTDEETVVNEIDSSSDNYNLDLDAPENKESIEFLAKVFNIPKLSPKLTLAALKDDLVSMDSKKRSFIHKLVNNQSFVNSSDKAALKLLEHLYNKLGNSGISSRKKGINKRLESGNSIALPSSDLTQMDQDDVGTYKLTMTIRNELHRIRRQKEDKLKEHKRNADQSKSFGDNRTKNVDARKNLLDQIEEMQMEEEVTHTIDIELPTVNEEQIKLPTEKLIMNEPYEEFQDEGIEMSDENPPIPSIIDPPNHPSIINPPVASEGSVQTDSGRCTPNSEGGYILPKRISVPVNDSPKCVSVDDSPFATPATPKKFKKVDKVLYLQVTEINRDKGANWNNKKYYALSEKIIMSEKLKLPKMSSWIPVSKNRLFDSELSMANIPYFGDQEISQEMITRTEILYNELLEKNEVKKQEDDEKERKNTEFRQLFNALLKIPVNIDEHCGFRPLSEIEDGFVKKHEAWSDLLYYFRAYAKEFPDETISCEHKGWLITVEGKEEEIFFMEGDADQLVINYEELLKNIPFENIDDMKVFDDMDNEDEDKVLNSYQSLHCRRCYEYDCKLHEENIANDTVHVESPYFLEQKCLIKMETQPCGADCYIHSDLDKTLNTSLSPPKSLSPRKSPRKSEIFSPISPGSPNKLNNYKRIDWNPTQEVDDYYEDTEVHKWSLYEKLFCQKLLSTYQNGIENGFCAVSRLMITKTCRQVFEKFRNDSLDTKKRNKKKKIVNGEKKKKMGNKKKPKLNARTALERVQNNHSYSPCYHPGLECNENCSCIHSDNFCDKFCYCDKNCKNRFRGCECKSICTSKHCSCFLANRECDPDLCKKCGACDFQHNPQPDSSDFSRCRNLTIQMNMGKELIIGKSNIDEAGWGCILGKEAKKDELIAEYVGEIITTKEVDSRGEFYDKTRCSYIFTLNNEFSVDAGRYGGKIRFANHSKTPNCNVKIMRVLGDFRIGLYAAKDLEKGVELFFNYGEHFVGHDLA